MLKFKTGKLPSNFVTLGIILLPVGIWRILEKDWLGFILLLTGLFLVFLNFGILISSKKFKIYTNLFGIKFGKYKSTENIKHLLIKKVNESQKINMLSLSKTEKNIFYKLYLEYPNIKILIMKDKKEIIEDATKKISKELNIEIVN